MEAGTATIQRPARPMPDSKGHPVALSPHFARYESQQGNQPTSLGHADESWDAVDFQNMFLARMPAKPSDVDTIIPSFHRPSLVRYWQEQHPDAWSDPVVRERIVLRPLPEDHPAFSGGNLDFDLIKGPWDVDNDSDGIPDSIWVDVGLPVQTNRAGVSYKPLAAVLCVDLDGRLNLNAHGNEAQLHVDHYVPLTATPAIAGLTTTYYPPRGLGTGPADINLGPLIGDRSRYRKLLELRHANRSRLTNDRHPGQPGNDAISDREHNDERLDVFAQRYTVVDRAGHPVVGGASLPVSRERIDDPYEAALVRKTVHDATFSIAELEQVLRVADWDQHTSASRFSKGLLDHPTIGPLEMSRLVSTHSSRIGTPSILPGTEMRGWMRPGSPGQKLLGESTSLAGMLDAQLIRHGVTDPTRRQSQLRMMLPLEVRKGEPMNINREFDGQTGQSVDPSRQTFARHLYCLLALVSNENFRMEVSQVEDAEWIRMNRMAQWAANVVDFRDSDAVMTPFEYDTNPFNGWQVDGDITTNEGEERAVVWGVEYPHLLLTESLAFHDLRLKDLNTEQVDGDAGTEPTRRHETAEGKQPDEDLDQVRIPEGSAFIELYCTGNPNSPATLPRELYSRDTDGSWKLDLGRIADSSGLKSPVWRMAISEAVVDDRDKTVWDSLTLAPDAMKLRPLVDGVPIESVVHFGTRDFADSQRTILAPGGGIFYKHLRTPTLIAPKQYAVVGPRAETRVGTGDEELAAPTVIQLNAREGNFVHVSAPHGEPYPDTRPALGIAVAMDLDPAQCGWKNSERQATFPNGVGLNISMPLPNSRSFYPPPNQKPDESAITDAYSPALDVPLDADEGRLIGKANFLGIGSHEDLRTVYLQRLANPTKSFDPVSNPYLTVDWLPIDLTVFNSEEKRPEDLADKVEWLSDTEPEIDPTIRFGSRERGLISENIWRAFSIAPLPSSRPESDEEETRPGRNEAAAREEEEEEKDNGLFDHILDHSLGFLNRKAFGSGISLPGYVGDPQNPLPWFTWSDRPFNNRMELLLVPSVSPSRLTWDFSIPGSGTPGNVDVYSGRQPLSFRAPYGHLLNFFQSSTDASPATDFCRLLDCVAVPSRFVGTRQWLSSGTDSGLFAPPHNSLSRFRDPGLVNINTIHDPRIWNAVCNFQIPWEKVQQSRGPVEDQELPTAYPNPFRSAFSSDVMPLATLEKSSAEATLLRSDPDRREMPLFSVAASEGFRDTEKHPFFRYQLLQQLGGRVTNHSNVFAIWVTVGFFRALPAEEGVSVAHPDGYTLGMEVGSDIGQVKRQRSFYIVDRSIPVAFESGKNHNVEATVLLRSRLE